MKILVTGAAGFIGYHMANRLCEQNHEVIGLDNINDYYSLKIKYDRLESQGLANDSIIDGQVVQSKSIKNYRFIKADLENDELLNELFDSEAFDYVINLAAQAGVRYSLENPHAYIKSNINGFINILEACRHNQIKHLIYASSSSVYGLNETMPFATSDNVDHPISLYAASKKSNELMAHTYSHLFNLPTTGLRFFTVYGPWGRPDMALFLFTKAILEGKPINVFNHGKMMRDFTYIDDITESINRLLEVLPKGDPNWSGKKPQPERSPAPYRIYNIGNNAPLNLMDFIKVIEKHLGITAEKNMMPIQAGDVPETYANVDALIETIKFQPKTSIETGVKNFIDWYKNYYRI